MNLIISLLGQKHHSLFNNKFVYDKLSKKDDFQLNSILNKFSFCKKIFIICSKNKILHFKKKNNIQVIHSSKTNNQIESILKVKNYIKSDEKVVILNPDSLLDVSFKDFTTHSDGIFFNIKKNDIRRNYNKKDIIFTNKKNQIVKIRKKSIFSENQIISAGLYYLKHWKFFLEAASNIKKINDKSLHVVDIFLEIIKSKNITTKSIKNFVCFEDDKKIEEYKFWKKYFTLNYKKVDKLNKQKIQNIIPSAGEGSRHKHLGYNLPKPLIPISKKMMFERSLESLPYNKDNLFIFKKNTFLKNNLKKKFFKNKKDSQYYLINKKTKGMAITIYKAKRLIKLNQPVIISSCDLKCVINYEKFYNIIKKMDPTGIIFTWSQYPPASESPNSHAYVVDRNSIIKKISEKKPISTSPDKDSAVTGIFYFKTGQYLLECIEHSIKNKITVNGEYYIATAMNKLLNEKKKIINFEVDQMISWSLPEHLKDYLFWEEKFTNVKSKI
tara:strand:+ start:5617 stop:7107 length:1491 start_codon:yes stop_codon:yes gene_type:complete